MMWASRDRAVTSDERGVVACLGRTLGAARAHAKKPPASVRGVALDPKGRFLATDRARPMPALAGPLRSRGAAQRGARASARAAKSTRSTAYSSARTGPGLPATTTAPTSCGTPPARARSCSAGTKPPTWRWRSHRTDTCCRPSDGGVLRPLAACTRERRGRAGAVVAAGAWDRAADGGFSETSRFDRQGGFRRRDSDERGQDHRRPSRRFAGLGLPGAGPAGNRYAA